MAETKQSKAIVTVRDLAAVAAFGCLLYGISQWSVPAAWVAGGGLVLALRIVPAVALALRGPAAVSTPQVEGRT